MTTCVEFLSNRITTYALALLLGLVTVTPIWWRILRRSLDFAEPSVWFALYYFAHFCMRALYDVTFGSPFLGCGPGEGEFLVVNLALLISILGYLCFWVGYNMRIGKAVARLFPGLPRKWNWRVVVPCAIVTCIVGWTGRLSLIISQAGSVRSWLTANKDELLRLSEGTTYLEIFSALPQVGLLLIIIALRARRRRGLAIMAALLFAPEVIFQLLSGSRAGLLFLLLKIYMANYLLSERTNQISLRFAYGLPLFLLLALLLFPLLSVLRFRGIAGIGEVSLPSPVALWKSSGDRLHGLDSLALIIAKVPKQVPYSLGSEIKLLAVSWVPRRIWPEKPTISLGEVFCEEMIPPNLFGEGTSVAVTLPGQFYWDLGVLGVTIGMTFVGILWRILHEYLVRPRKNLSNMLVVAALFPSFFMAVEQDLVSIFSKYLLILLLASTVSVAISKKVLGVTIGRSLPEPPPRRIWRPGVVRRGNQRKPSAGGSCET